MWKSDRKTRESAGKVDRIVGTESSPAKMKNGQVIINKKATKQNLQKLKAINEDGLSKKQTGKTTTDGTDGGLLKGPPHYDENGKPTGGIPVVVDNSRNIEVEGEEFVVNAEASKKHWQELSKINQSTGNGVPIGPPNGAVDEDPEEYDKGGKIQFNPNHVPNKWILQFAEKVRTEHPKVWDLGGNIFGNEAYKNLKRVSERGYWLDSEEWMYIKWQSYIARHKKDFRIAGVIAMLKWVDKVDRGWAYMKGLIQERIKKETSKPGWKHKNAPKMKGGGDLIKRADGTYSKRGLWDNIRDNIGSGKKPTKQMLEQEAKIKREAKYHLGGDMSKHLAPNGKPSNLTHEQWHLVRTPEFKAWFGDWERSPKTASQVVDENGEPLVVYRGDSSASKKGNIFKTGFNRMGFVSKNRLPNQYFHYFVNNYDVAMGYAKNQIEDHNDQVEWKGKGKKWDTKVTPYFLNIRKPIDITPNNKLYPTFEEFKAEYKKQLGEEWYKNREYRMSYDYGFEISYRQLNKIYADKLGKDYLENEPRWSHLPIWSKEQFETDYRMNSSYHYFIEYKDTRFISDILYRVYNKMVERNFDGLIFLESTHWNGGIFGDDSKKYESGKLKYDYKRWVEKPKVFAALESNQIKLADGSNTTFDSENPDIRFDEGGNTDYAELYQVYVLDHNEPVKVFETYNMNEAKSVLNHQKSLGRKDAHIQYSFKDGGVTDSRDTVTLDIPLLIRTLELAREDIKSDADLHRVVENLIEIKNKRVLTMDDYNYIAHIKKHTEKMKQGGTTQAQREKIAKVMNEYKSGNLHSGSKQGPIVTDRKQAIAIALSEANASRYSGGGSVEEIDLEKAQLISEVDKLVAQKKRLYSNVDIESPMSVEEKELNAHISKLFSKIFALNLMKRQMLKEPKMYAPGGNVGFSQKLYRGVGDRVNVTYGKRTDEGLGDFWTNNRTMAEWFAGLNEYNVNTDRYEPTNGNGKVLEQVIEMNNPYIIDSSHPDYELDNEVDSWQILMDEMNAKNKDEVQQYVSKLIQQGYDGVVMKDNQTNFYADDTYDIVVKFTEEQMKNAGITMNNNISTNVTDYKNPYEVNRAIEKLLESKGTDRDEYTPDEIKFISYYSGYGGLEKLGSFSDEELKGLLYEFFTPDEVVRKMWGLAYKYGYGTIADNSVFEPSVGVGAFLKYAPEDVPVVANEINPVSAKITQILYPEAHVILQPFEKNFIKSNLTIKSKIDDLQKYSLVIGNPPYGMLKSKFISMGEGDYSMAGNWIEYFITRGLDLLHPGGLLIYIVGAEQFNGGTLFLDSPISKVKRAIFDKAELLDAYRLPRNVFERTGVSSEIIVLKKK